MMVAFLLCGEVIIVEDYTKALKRANELIAPYMQ